MAGLLSSNYLFCLDRYELDVKDKRCVPSDRTSRRSIFSVGEVCRNKELPFGTFLHELQSLAPALHHAAHRNRRRLAPLIRAVELGPVDQRTTVVHRHGITG